MDDNPRANLSRLLDMGLSLPSARRLAWVDALGEEYAAIKPRLRALLERSCRSADDASLHTLPKLERTSVVDVTQFGRSAHAVGSVVGDYQLVKCLGSGAMGVVWQALRRVPGEPSSVAIKFAHAAPRRPDLSARFLREQQLLAALDHPHIARMYAADVTAQGQPYLVLEYVEGVTLHEYCEGKRRALVERLGLFSHVVEAVAHAHERQIVHRDLKPGNVLVDPRGHARLLDFGIGKLLSDDIPDELQLSKMTGQPLTPAYASPEQILGAPAGFASDIYSLGVLLYELLTGARPYTYRRGSNRALRDAILASVPNPPSERAQTPAEAAHMRGDLDAIVLTALNKAPHDRHPSARHFARAIDAALGNLRGTSSPS